MQNPVFTRQIAAPSCTPSSRGELTSYAAASVAERRSVPLYRDFTAIAVALTINAYPLSAVVATFLGTGESSLPGIIARALTLMIVATSFFSAFWQRRLLAPDAMLTAFCAIYTARLAYDWNSSHVDGADVAMLFFWGSCALPALVFGVTQKLWDDRNVARVLMISGAIICFGAYQIMNDEFTGGAYLEATGRLGFEKLNPISLGHAASTTLLASLVLWVAKPSLVWRIMIAVMAGTAAFVLVAAASRGALVTFAVCAAALALARGLWGLVTAAAIALVAAGAIFAAINFDAFLDQTGLSRIGADQSSAARYMLYEIALQEIQENWLLGSAYTLPWGLSYPHNIFLESWMATGVFGFAMFLLLCIRGSLRAARELAQERPLLALLLMQNLIGSQFSGAIYIGWPGLWLALAVLLTARNAATSKERLNN